MRKVFTGIRDVAQIFPETFDGTGNEGSLIKLAALHVQGVRFRIPEKWTDNGIFPLI